ncbi:hypothetical protein U1Q18_014227 [Sarracenia purpurea var. burkii]
MIWKSRRRPTSRFGAPTKVGEGFRKPGEGRRRVLGYQRGSTKDLMAQAVVGDDVREADDGGGAVWFRVWLRSWWLLFVGGCLVVGRVSGGRRLEQGTDLEELTKAGVEIWCADKSWRGFLKLCRGSTKGRRGVLKALSRVDEGFRKPGGGAVWFRVWHRSWWLLFVGGCLVVGRVSGG